MVKNVIWTIFGLLVTFAGVIHSFKKGILWGTLFLVVWFGIFIYAIRHYRKVAERMRQGHGIE